METKGYIRNISWLFIPIMIGLFIPYILLLNHAQSWYVLAGVMAIGLFLLLLIRYKIPFLYFVLFLLFGVMSTSIKPFDVIFVLMFFLMLLLKRKKLLQFNQLKLVNLSLFFFGILSLLSILSSSYVKEGFTYFIHTLFVMFIFYFLYLFANEEKVFKSILWGYTGSAILSALLVTGEFLGIYSGFYTLFQGVRAKGLFLDPNDFAPYLVLAILLLLYQFTTRSLKKVQSYGYLLLSLYLLGILLTSLSRAAMLNIGSTLFIFFIFYLLNRESFRHLAVFIGTILAGAITIFLWMHDTIINWLSLRFYASDGMIQTYDTDRFYYQLQGLKLGSTHVLGIGPGQFELLMHYATHNLYIRIIAENGWLSFLLFINVILLILIPLVKNRYKKVWGLPIYLFLSGYIGLLINSFFLDTLHWRYFWFYLGLCAVLLVNVKQQSIKQGWKK